MTTQQRRQVYRDLRFYRLAIHTGLYLATGLRFAVVTTGGMKAREAERGRLLSQYLVCVN